MNTPCKYCGASVIWVVIDQSGAKCPMDKTAPTYTIERDMLGEFRANRSEAYVSHWSTCRERDKAIAERNQNSPAYLIDRWKREDEQKKILGMDVVSDPELGPDEYKLEPDWAPAPWAGKGWKPTKEKEK